jgi:3-oxoadipate enol-lactonase
MPYVTLSGTAGVPGLTLRYETWGDRPGVPTLLLVHELGGALDSFREFGKLLAGDCRVVAFDQRGAGLSEKPTKPFSLQDLAEDISRLADALSLPRPFHLMGLAMGVITAMQFASRQGDRVASLVLCDGTPEIEEKARRYVLERAAKVRREGMASVAEGTFNNAFSGMRSPGENPAWAEYRRQFLGNSPESYAMHSEALARMDLSVQEIARIQCPALVLSGRHDFLWGPETGRALASKLPHARFEVIEDAAHFPPIQNPKAVAVRVADFMRRRE